MSEISLEPWQGDEQVLRNMDEFGRRVQRAIRAVADMFQPRFENYAKQNARWTDRTANARQSLHAYVEELSAEVVELFISHGVSYGIFLFF